MEHRCLLSMMIMVAAMVIRPGHCIAQEVVWRSYLDSAQKAIGEGDLVAADRLLALAEKEAESFGPSDPRRLQTWNLMSGVAERQYQYGKAASLLRKALILAERGKNKALAAHQQTLLANHYRLIGDHDKAEPLYKSALAIRESVNGTDAWETAQLIRDLADNHRDAGRMEAAEALYKRALSILEGKADREYHTAFCLANLGELYVRQGKAAEGEALCREAMAIYDRQLAPVPLNKALCYGTIGEALRQQKKLAQAVKAVAAALVQMDAARAPDIRTLPMLQNAARTYREHGDDAKATELESRAAAIAEHHTSAPR